MCPPLTSKSLRCPRQHDAPADSCGPHMSTVSRVTAYGATAGPEPQAKTSLAKRMSRWTFARSGCLAMAWRNVQGLWVQTSVPLAPRHYRFTARTLDERGFGSLRQRKPIPGQGIRVSVVFHSQPRGLRRRKSHPSWPRTRA